MVLSKAITSARSTAGAATAWVYLRHELLYLCWALMEIALIAPLALAFMPWARYWSPAAFALWLLLIMFLPFNLSRVFSLAQVPLERQRKFMLLAFLATAAISIRTLLYETSSIFDLSWLVDLWSQFAGADNAFWGSDLIVFFLVVVLWWRGLSLAERPVEVEDVGLRLRLGGLILAPIVIILSSLPQRVMALPFILLFFVSGLMAVALTRAEQLALDYSDRGYPLQPRWVSMVFLTSLLIVLAAGFVALVLSDWGLERLVAWLAPLWQALAFFTVTLATTLGYLFAFLFPPLERLLRFLVRVTGLENLSLPPLAEPAAAEEMEWLRPDPSVLLWANRFMAIALIVAALFFLYWGLVRYFRWRGLALSSEEMAGLAGAAEAEESGLGKRLLQRLGLWRQWRAASIRRIYRQMCAAAAANGYARLSFETPYEYLDTLAEAWPEGGAETELITHAYVRVRYGELPESAEEMEEIRAAWRRLQEMRPAD